MIEWHIRLQLKENVGCVKVHVTIEFRNRRRWVKFSHQTDKCYIPKVILTGPLYSSFVNRALPFVTETPSFFAFSTISKRFFAPTAEATRSTHPTSEDDTNFNGIGSIVHQKHVNISCIVDKKDFMT